MSPIHHQWALKQCLEPSKKLILMLLVSYIDPNQGHTHLTLRELEKQSGYARKTVTFVLAELESLGLINKSIDRYNGNKYTFNLDVIMPYEVENEDEKLSTKEERGYLTTPRVVTSRNHGGYPTTPPVVTSCNHDGYLSTPPNPPDQDPKLIYNIYNTKRESNIRAREKPKLSLPDDFQPNAKHIQLANELNVDLKRSLIAFKAHCDEVERTFSPGKWDSAFEVWLANEKRKLDAAPAKNATQEPKPSAHKAFKPPAATVCYDFPLPGTHMATDMLMAKMNYYTVDENTRQPVWNEDLVKPGSDKFKPDALKVLTTWLERIPDETAQHIPPWQQSLRHELLASLNHPTSETQEKTDHDTRRTEKLHAPRMQRERTPVPPTQLATCGLPKLQNLRCP